MDKQQIQEFERVKIKKNGIIGTVVDISKGKNGKIYIVESDTRNSDGGFDLYDCTENEVEKEFA